MKNSHYFLAAAFACIAAITVGCSGGAGEEPRDMIDGFAVDLGWRNYKLVETDGTPVFAGKQLVDSTGRKYDGSLLTVKAEASHSVGGFFRIGKAGRPLESGRQYLLSKELDSKGNLVFIGPFYSVGLFYDDLAPATLYNDGICYINKKGEIAFHIEDILGFPVDKAGNFISGLSIFEAYHVNAREVNGAVDKKGNLIIEPKYKNLEYVGSGLWAGREVYFTEKSYDVSDSTSVMNNKGEVVFKLPYSYGDGYPHFSGDYGVAGSGNEYYALDKNGNMLEMHLGDYRLTSRHYDGLFVVQSPDRQYGLFNTDGFPELVCIYDNIDEIGEDYVITERDGYKHLHLKNGSDINMLSDLKLCPTYRSLFVMDEYICVGYSNFYSMEGDFLNGYLSENRGGNGPEAYAYDMIYSDNRFNKEKKPVAIGVHNHIDEVYAPSQDLYMFGLSGEVRSCKVMIGRQIVDHYEFDKAGNLVSCFGKELTDETLKRDDKGRIIMLTVDDGTEEITYEYKYNDDGSVRSMSDSYGNHTEYEYNTHGVPMRHTSYWDEAMEYEYVYTDIDPHANWKNCNVTSVDYEDNRYTYYRDIRYHGGWR